MSNITSTNYLTDILQSAGVHISFLKTKKPPSWPPLSQNFDSATTSKVRDGQGLSKLFRHKKLSWSRLIRASSSTLSQYVHWLPSILFLVFIE